MTVARCYWCGRFGAAETTYRLGSTTPSYTRALCPSCAASALTSTAIVSKNIALTSANTEAGSTVCQKKE
jgi:hypothetical protein